MTAPGDSGDIAGVAALPRVVLDDDGLDLLELVLGGWLPPSALPSSAVPAGPEAGPRLVLTDAENNPLALVQPGRDDAPVVRALWPCSRGSGPHWDPAVRLSAADVRARVGRAQAVVLACIVDDVPTRVDLDVLVSSAGQAGANFVVVMVPVARRARPAGEVGWAGLTRAAWAVAGAMEAARPDRPVVRLVLPWPADGPPDLEQVLAAAGSGLSARVTELRSADELERTSALPDILEREVVDLYPPASAREVLGARRTAPDRGAVVLFTGLSGSGKSTIARALADEMADRGPRRVTLLDGDEVRQHLSRELGFDAESRAINIDRIAWVASLVAAHGGIAVAAPIAPFAAGRRAARAMAEPHGTFLLVHVSTPLEVCEARDRKGLYARARAGQLLEFTGISSPYEVPDDADVIIDTTTVEVADAVRIVLEALESRMGDAGGAAGSLQDAAG